MSRRVAGEGQESRRSRPPGPAHASRCRQSKKYNDEPGHRGEGRKSREFAPRGPAGPSLRDFFSLSRNFGPHTRGSAGISIENSRAIAPERARDGAFYFSPARDGVGGMMKVLTGRDRTGGLDARIFSRISEIFFVRGHAPGFVAKFRVGGVGARRWEISDDR